MVCKAKTFNAAQGGYEAPQCKVYRITVESVIAGSDGYGDSNEAGDDLGGGSTYEL